MKTALVPFNEDLRLAQLHQSGILDTPYEKDFDDIVQLASQICKTPISLISLVDENRQWFKAKTGVDDTETDRSVSFCAHTILEEEEMEINDTALDERFADSPFVTDPPKVRFYAGFPVVNNGFKIGTLCVLDTVPRKLKSEQKFALRVLSSQVSKMIELNIKIKEDEKRLLKAAKDQRKLVNSNQAQSQIISYIAHDVRNPITALKSIIQMNDLKLLSPQEIDDLMAMLNKQVDGTLDILTNLIEWGHAQIHRKVPHVRTVNLYDLAIRKFKNLEISAQLKGNSLLNKVHEGCNVTCDEYLLRFILRNLVTNANKFTSNGCICIEAACSNNITTIKVTDNGVGMTTDFKDNLFKQNTRNTNPGTNNEKGSGLGLMLTKGFIEKLGSSLLVESEEGNGSVFSFSLPTAV